VSASKLSETEIAIRNRAMNELGMAYSQADKAWSECIHGRYGRSAQHAQRARKLLAHAILRMQVLPRPR